MPKKTYGDKDSILILPELQEHYRKGTDDNDQRRLRENGWNDIIKAYFGKLPEDWPYLAMVVDPLIRTTILEKTSRLFNGKLKGRLNPREGGDVVKAKINNAILDFQWDNANFGGAMIEKWALMDVQTRLFGASFALCYWRVSDEDGYTTFEGNEFKVLDNRDVRIDYTASHIRDANWAQVSEWKTLDELEDENEKSPFPLYKNLKLIKSLLKEKATGDPKEHNYESMVKDLRGLENRVGADPSFPTFEVVTEYRRDRWITFLPRLNVVIRDIQNPYKHKKIPIVQLRYYSVGDDVYGESEVEPVLPIWRAVNALLCGTIDEVNLRSKPPIKISGSSARLETIQYGPNALWLVGDSQNNVAELQTGGEVISNFQTMYSALKQAFTNAMGELSQGVGQADPFNPDKTATEVRATAKQQLSRDQYNQLYLEQALKDQMFFWLSNNKQFMFSDPTKAYQILKITGKEIIKDLQQYGLDQVEPNSEALNVLAGIIQDTGGEISDIELEQIVKQISTPRHAVITNPDEKDPENYQIEQKMKVEADGESASLYLLPDDLDGYYDYIPSIQSLSANSDEMRRQGRQRSLSLLLSAPIQQQLQLEGEKLQIKDLLVQVLNDDGLTDADRFFERIPAQPAGAGVTTGGITPQTVNPNGGMAGTPQPVQQTFNANVPQPQGLQG